MIKTYLGEEGLSKSWQNDFPKTIKCHKCKGKCKPMFTSFENFKKGDKYVCNVNPNKGKGKYWVHDCIACTVYLCEECFEPNARINQA